MAFTGLGGPFSYGLAGKKGPFTQAGRGGISEFLLGKEPSMQQLPTMDPQQMQLLSQLLGGLGQPLGQGLQNLSQMLSGEPGALEAFQAPAMRQFQEEIVPGLAERFSGMGAGAQRSSAFQQALGSAGASLAERLSAQRAGLQQGAMGQLSQLLGMGMGQRPFGYMQQEGTPGFFGSLAGGAGQAAGMLPFLL
jgi:hypothetical protein